jgi:hypothetical protein
MEKEISNEEFYALNNDLIVSFSKISIDSNFRMISGMNGILLGWQESFQLNSPIINILNPVFINFSKELQKVELSKIQLFSKLVSEITNICHHKVTNYTELFGNIFFTKWDEAVANDNELNKKDSHNFNILKMFQISETKHSQLLQLLLNPNSIHGQGNLFLNLFLEKIGIKEPSKGSWKVTAEEGRIDLLLKRNNPLSIVIIENKSNYAEDQQNQLYRYWFNEIYKASREVETAFYEQNKDSYQMIYLVPNGKNYDYQTIKKPQNFDVFNTINLPDLIPMEIKRLTFNEDIFNLIGDCIELIENFSVSNYRIREYLKQYQEICINL